MIFLPIEDLCLVQNTQTRLGEIDNQAGEGAAVDRVSNLCALCNVFHCA